MTFAIRSPRIILMWLGLLSPCFGQKAADCSKVPDHDKLRTALIAAVKEGAGANSGLGNQEWASVVNRDGTVRRCLLPDGLHPSLAGYRVLTNALRDPLQAFLGQPVPRGWPGHGEFRPPPPFG